MLVNILAILAGAVQALGFVVYFHKVRASQVQPNTSSWFLWVLLGIVNATSFNTMPEVDWIKACVAIVNALCNLGFAAYALRSGKFERLTPFEWTATLIGVAATGGWYVTNNAQVGNAMLQCAFVLSFAPLYMALWRNPKREQTASWWCWTSSHVIGVSVVIITWNGHPLDLLYSSMQIPLCLGVILLTKRTVTS